MVKGIDVFREHFKDYKDKYVLIGGTACDLLFNENGLSFRATRDLDIVLIAEALTPEFGQKFWEFVQNGKYEIRLRSTGNPIFYRFQNPQDTEYPTVLELFSRSHDTLNQVETRGVFTTIPLGDDISSLSAILLNEAYYDLIKKGAIEIDGLSLISEAYLLLFKAKAWLDLTSRRESGDRIDSKDIKKHKIDVVRLATIFNPNLKIKIAGEVKADLEEFLTAYENDPVNLKSLKLGVISQADIIDRIKNCFQINR